MIIVATPLVAARYDFSGYQGALIPFRFLVYQGQWNGQQPVTLGATQDLTGWSFTLTIKGNAAVPDANANYIYGWGPLTGPNGGLVAADVPAATSISLPPGPYRYDLKAIVVNGDPQELIYGWYQHQAA